MKRLLYLISVVVFAAGLNSCNKSSDPAPDPVVGKWELSRIRFSGYATPYTSLNGDEAPDAYGIKNSLTINNDKSFAGKSTSNGRIADYKGTWDVASTKLNLKYDDGDSETLNLDTSGQPNLLLTDAFSAVDSLQNPTTKKIEAVPFKYQFIYEKQ
ncbi:lipocalin family protein [Larkinella terrae]|uniref:Lipocalin-like domain-containing protein n=1 Tax=Larkinella terrae TaxID=2025311 RepID=A0A7K0ESU8_9BACT|nr:lipocalin family protein [Larkinella terrae]MRS64894.1 hypothetical protein [Larkinella terrae]